MSPTAMTFEEWWDTFKPIKNVVAGDARDFNNTLFQTFGQEYQVVLLMVENSPGHVWTLLDCDGVRVITDGWHYVNRVGYFITELPADEDVHYEVIYDEPN